MRLRRFAVPAIVVAIAGYFVVFGGEYSLLDLVRLEKQRRAEAAELQALRDSLATLRARVDSLENDPAALERIAREKYGLIRDGERLYRFAEKDSAAAGKDSGGAAAP